jgi:hypothetical protein
MIGSGHVTPLPDYVEVVFTKYREVNIPVLIQQGYEYCSVLAFFNFNAFSKVEMILSLMQNIQYYTDNENKRVYIKLSTLHAIMLDVAERLQKASGVYRIVCLIFVLFFYYFIKFFPG